MVISRPNEPTLGAGSKTTSSWFYWALAAVVVVSGFVRFGCLFNDLWLDEIWSIRSVEKIRSPMQILTDLWHDNNHPINSLFIYLLMPAKNDWTYRLFSWFSGAASIWLAGLIARRQWQLLHPGQLSGKAEIASLMTAMLFGGSYLLIHYSSEARGYAPAVGFCLLAFYALLHTSSRPVSAWTVIYGLACIAGLLSHLVAFQVILAGLVWSAVKAINANVGWRFRLVYLAGWHLGPWMFLGVYYLGFVRKVEIGGGPENSLTGVLGDLATYTLNLPTGSGVFVALSIFLVVIFVALELIWRRDRALTYFYATAIFIAPALGLSASGFALLFPRYFIVSAACALLLGGYVLAELWQGGRVRRGVCLALLVGFLSGGAVHTARLMHYGRGQYQQALRYVAANTTAATITVSSDYDDRNFCVIEYYSQAVGINRKLQYYASDLLTAVSPQWLFLHRLDGGAFPPPDIHVAGENYRLERVFHHAVLSGWDWYVYRNLKPASQP